jgi:hypothetical protein
MFGREFPGRLFNQQNLAIDAVVHRVSSSGAGCRFLMLCVREKRSTAHIVRCGQR